MDNGLKPVYFFLGTEAELIKIFPVIMECIRRGQICNIIASGQNDLKKSRILKQLNLNGKFMELSREEDIVKSAKGLVQWFLHTKKNAVAKIVDYFGKENIYGTVIVVHGDTVSTLMGAMVGKKLGCTVCHVEAGLRSHNLLNPFPEEIDRLLVSRRAALHFAPGKEPTLNLKHAKGQVVNTEYNTILDSLKCSTSIPIVTEEITHILDLDYFVFVMHRQENLINKEFVKNVIMKVEKYAKSRKCVLILHKITEGTLEELGLLNTLKENPNFILLPRVDYFDFMKLLNKAQFVITDGGSNQEELYYMGKPCLIMRKTTERQEGLGVNAILYDGNLAKMDVFVENFKQYKKESIVEEYSPCSIIADVLIGKSKASS